MDYCGLQWCVLLHCGNVILPKAKITPETSGVFRISQSLSRKRCEIGLQPTPTSSSLPRPLPTSHPRPVIQWRRAHWARSGLGPTLNTSSRARSGLVRSGQVNILDTCLCCITVEPLILVALNFGVQVH